MKQAWQDSSLEHRCYLWLSLVLLVTVVVIGACTFQDYGMSVDEPYRWKGGQEKLNYYEHLFAGDSEAYTKSDWYPGFFDLTVAVLEKLLPLNRFHTGHLLSFVFGIASYIGVWMIGRHLGGVRMAFWALLFIIVMPRFYGHIYINPKDVPFAACFVWGLYFLLKLIGQYRMMPWGALIGLGIAIGLTTAVRVGGLLLAFYTALAFLVCSLCLYYEKGISSELRLSGFKRIVRGFALAGIVGFLTLFPWWPYIHTDTIARLMEAAMGMSSYPWNGFVKHDGVLFDQNHIPRFYILDWAFITIPIFYQGLFLGAIILYIAEWIRARTWARAPRFIQLGLLFFCVFFPVVFIIIKHSTVYNGMRHVYFILHPMAVLCAYFLVCSLDWLKQKNKYWERVGIGATLLAVSCLVVSMFRLHPYEYVYFNAWVGGLPGAAERYDLEYWATAHREAIMTLEKRLAEEESETGIKRTYKVATSPPYHSNAYFFPDNFVWQYMDEPDNPDFFIALNMLDYPERLDGELYDTVERMGVPLVYIYDRRHLVPQGQEDFNN